MRLSRETFWSGETHRISRKGLSALVQLCALPCPGNSPKAELHRDPLSWGSRGCAPLGTEVSSVIAQGWALPTVCVGQNESCTQNQPWYTCTATLQGRLPTEQPRERHQHHTKLFLGAQRLVGHYETSFHGLVKLPLYHCTSPPVCCKYLGAAESHTPTPPIHPP